MICNRHGRIAAYAEYGQLFCLRCFREAITKAEDILLERKLSAMRQTWTRSVSNPALTSADALIRRLGGR